MNLMLADTIKNVAAVVVHMMAGTQGRDKLEMRYLEHGRWTHAEE